MLRLVIAYLLAAAALAKPQQPARNGPDPTDFDGGDIESRCPVGV